MKLVLDGMQQMMEGPDSGTFDEDFFSDLVQCFDKFDPLLMEAQDKAYAGMMEYAAAGGQRFDEWVSCQEIQDQGLVIYNLCQSFASVFKGQIFFCGADTRGC